MKQQMYCLYCRNLSQKSIRLLADVNTDYSGTGKDVSGKQICLSGTLHLLVAQATNYGSYCLLKTPTTKSCTLAHQDRIANNVQRDQMAQETEP